MKIQDYKPIQPTNKCQFNLLHKLRSKCYQTKLNFIKLNTKNIKCVLNCDQFETQAHIFDKCEAIRAKLKLNKVIKIYQIYGSLELLNYRY